MKLSPLFLVILTAIGVTAPALAKYYIYKPVTNLVTTTPAPVTPVTPVTPVEPVTPPTTPPVVKATIIESNGVKAWSTGETATSCAGYLTNDATHDASNATNGFYSLSIGGAASFAYCDMSGGGWMQVANGKRNTLIGTWKDAVAGMAMPTTVTGLTTSTWKLSDTVINSIPKQAYKVVGTGSYSATRYFKGTCNYRHTTVVSGDCATSYANADFTGAARVGREGKGLSDHTGAGGYFVMTNNHTGYEGYGWCVGQGSSGAGGCGAAGSLVDISIWVK